MPKCVRLTCAFLVAGAALFAQSTIPAVVTTTGMVGLAEDQTARLNLLNPGVLPPATGAVCTASVVFMNAAGTVVKSATVTVAPGKSGGVILDSLADLNLAVGARQEIRAVITLQGAPPVAAGSTLVPACKLIPTLEVFDTLTGRTLVVLGRAEAVAAAN
jgi:hypothetical protein